ncbi:Predicted DNA-binding transcriptional regulator YafY, contains an HTH and WYL domains [Paenibacillus sp. UNCCL117]|uniref:helix-turn-helix transcriptional regulator n=1 Tax=unclassified Paenibacillus TaxID=185978 RepID=UPI00088F201B|nr:MULTISPECIES: YafY family protein [unclassified Paenibacillus]SDE15670.1 Predicted DNA-binding transcriptional regulator YafY, contains an HTH and WYL domains [Paenibacillus sp. cl123]SFW60963.1 Predicted DNA-binding transcriptional regulator YafY, contains an HTH and WYL domains [Paenibacillus sp. UNCCL117]
MRADRLVSIMLLLQNQAKLTTGELASRLEVSERTILRDMDALSASGVPVVADRGKGGGWRLLDRFRSQLSGMKLADLQALVIMPSDTLLKDLGVQTEAEGVRQKLLASLPGSFQSEAMPFIEKIFVDTAAWRPSRTALDAFRTVQQAVWEDKLLSIRYEKADGSRSERVVLPLGLVAKGSTWYLVAASLDGEYRTYRVSRIHEASLPGETFVRPEAFRLADYWRQSKESFIGALPSYKVQVLAHSSIIRRMTFTDKFIADIRMEEADADGWVPVSLTFNDEQQAVEYVLGFGPQIRLLQPRHLIAEIAAQAAAVAEMYRAVSVSMPEGNRTGAHDRQVITAALPVDSNGPCRR